MEWKRPTGHKRKPDAAISLVDLPELTSGSQIEHTPAYVWDAGTPIIRLALLDMGIESFATDHLLATLELMRACLSMAVSGSQTRAQE